MCSKGRMNAISTVKMIRGADSKARSIRKSRPHATVLYAYAVVLALCHYSAVVAGARKLQQPTAEPGGSCGPSVWRRCPCTQCCSQFNFCGITPAHCGSGCQSAYGSCSGAGPDPAPPSQPPPPGQDDSAAGVSRSQFSAVFAGDTDKCGASCPGFSSQPNSADVINKHWELFKSAAGATGFRLQNADEASIFFGNIKHEYGGNLNQMREFCGRQSGSCPGYGIFYGRGPLQLTWDYNYAAMGRFVGTDLKGNPDLVADADRNIGWQTAMYFWTGSDFNCQGSWVGGGAPTCPDAARAGNMADVTRRINPGECDGGQFSDRQPARVEAVQSVRRAWGLGGLSNTFC